MPLPRREAFDPSKNAVITVGAFDGREMKISPVIENLEEENSLIMSFYKMLQESPEIILTGYNILHFDIPYVVCKLKSAGQETDLSQFKPLDLYWILPYWFDNSSYGKRLAEFSSLGQALEI